MGWAHWELKTQTRQVQPLPSRPPEGQKGKQTLPIQSSPAPAEQAGKKPQARSGCTRLPSVKGRGDFLSTAPPGTGTSVPPGVR